MSMGPGSEIQRSFSAPSLQKEMAGAKGVAEAEMRSAEMSS